MHYDSGAPGWWLIAFCTSIWTDRILQSWIVQGSLFPPERATASLQLLRVSGTAGARFESACICRRVPWQRGVARTAPERKKHDHPHEGSVTDLLILLARLLLRCPNILSTPSLLIQLELVDKTTLSMRMRDPSEKIHSQIRRPSFSDSLLTVDSKRVLTGPQKHYSGPKRALPRTRRVSDSKMLPTSGQDSFCWSNNFIRSPEARAGRGGTAYAVSRQVCIAAVSESVTLSVRTAPL